MDWRGDGIAVGITVGNSSARVAVLEGGNPQIVPLEEGERFMPSAVLLHRLREVGKYACLYSGTDPNLLVTSINRLLGRRYSDLERDLHNFPFETRNESNRVRIVGQLGDIYAPIELYAMVLRKLQKAVERYMNRPVAKAVIAVPGSFDDFQRRSVRTAAESVFQQVKLINEPTAALLALQERSQLMADERLMTFDMGAGKCEAAIIERKGSGRVQIKSIAGDTHLGGDDIDYLIFNQLARRFEQEQGESMISDSAMARHEVLMSVRAAKHQLERAEEATISVPFVNFDRFGRPLHLFATISRAGVKSLCKDLLDRAARLIEQCKNDANCQNLTRVLLLGGGSRLPSVSQMVHRYSGKQPLQTENPEELAALGASLHAACLAGLRKGIQFEDVTAHSLGITTNTGRMGFVLNRQSVVPALTTKKFVTVEHDQREVHIEVREGERQMASENPVIGEFLLPLPPRLPKGSPIDVTIGKDGDGIVLVRARDNVSGSTREITINYDL
jgi:molecular chaperone DnaK